MIALLFGLLGAAMLAAWRGRVSWGYGLFAVAMVLSVYWLKFHATSQLTIQL
jgi:hypothetical protein